MLNPRDIGGLQGAPVIGRDDDRLGTVGQVFLDAQTGSPNWITVKTGLFGHKETFVPLENASFNGEEVHVDVDRETLKEAPRIDADEALSPHNEEALYRYYGMSDVDTDGGTAQPDRHRDDADDDRRTVTPVPTGLADADRARNDNAPTATPVPTGLADADRARNADTSRNTDADRDDDRPRDLAELHRNDERNHDLRLSEQPLGEPGAIPVAHDDQPGKHARLRRYNPATDSGTGEPTIDRTNPPRNL